MVFKGKLGLFQYHDFFFLHIVSVMRFFGVLTNICYHKLIITTKYHSTLQGHLPNKKKIIIIMSSQVLSEYCI